MDSILELIDKKSRYECESLESLHYLMKELTLLRMTGIINASRTANVFELYEDHISYAQLPESLL